MGDRDLARFQYRAPWYLLGILLLGTLIATFAAFESTQAHMAEHAAQADALQRVLFIDIDAFSLVNDTLGHESGDSRLIAIANALRTAFEGAVVARFGADEFVVLISAAVAEASVYAARVKQVLAQPVKGHSRASFSNVLFRHAPTAGTRGPVRA